MDGVGSSVLARAGVYRREVNASLARIWENVFDWEHLPSLHARDFAACTLLEAARWGWRVRLVSQPGDETKAQILELRADRTRHFYCTTTLEGPGAGSEIRVQLTPRGPKETLVEVEFHVPEMRPERLERIGAGYVDVYRRLWDEDEAMMIERERALGRRKRRAMSSNAPKTLGGVDEVRAKLPLVVFFGGERFRLVELDGALVAHAATCPHWLGPFDDAPLVDGAITCPWHGYAFDVASGESRDGRGLKLATPPRVLVSDGVVRLEAAR